MGFEKTSLAIGCLVVQVNEIIEEMDRRGMSSKKIAQAIDLWFEKEAHLLLVRVDLADPVAVFLSTPAMARAGWEIFIQIGGNIMSNMAKCPECGCCEVEMPLHPIKGEIVICPDCGVELELVSIDPIKLGLAPQEDEDWGE